MKREYVVSIDFIEDPPENEKIVRCKYCKYSKEWYGNKRRCFLWNENGIDVFEDGYCSYGRPKQEGR